MVLLGIDGDRKGLVSHMSNISRRSFVVGGGLLSMGLLAACSGSQVGQTSTDTGAADASKEVYDMSMEEEEEAMKKEPAYGKELQVGYTGGLCLGAFGIADVQGFNEAEGLTCNIISGESTVDALGSGKLDASGTHIAKLLVPAYNGVGITFTLGLHSGCKSLYVLSDGGFNTTADLKGTTIGIPEGIGGADHHIGMRFVGRDGIDPTSEVEWKQVAKEACVQALQNDEIQAAVLEDQYAEAFVKQGIIKYIRSLTYDDDFKIEPCCILAFNADFAKNNPVHVKRYTRAMQKAGQWIQDNTEEALQIMFDHSWATGDHDACLNLMKAFDYTISEQQTKDALLEIIGDYKKYDIIDSDKNVDDVLNTVWTPVLGAVE